MSEKEADKVAKKAEQAAQKAAKNAEKEARRQARSDQQASGDALLAQLAESACGEETFGYLRLNRSTAKDKSSREWTRVEELDEGKKGEHVWVRGRIYQTRFKGNLGFITLREGPVTVQCVLDAGKTATKEMLKWSNAVPIESIVDIMGVVEVPEVPVASTSQKVEIAVHRIFCVSKCQSELPFQVKDANMPEDADGIKVLQDVRLDNRVLDLRTFATQAVLRVATGVCEYFREYLRENRFVEIHSPKLLGGSSEGGANVFKLPYFEKSACLSQSPQLYKQMAICGDFDRVFETGPVFRAENSNTHRHLCEFTGLDLEMTFKDSYDEVLDFLEGLFIHIFERVTKHYAKEIEVIHSVYPNTAFKWTPKGKTPRLAFSEGVELLRQSGCEGIPDDITNFDIGTEQEKALGKIIKQKYDTDFYMLIGYPTAVRAFYSMPTEADPAVSNSYDFFMRGEEITSGAQRINDPEMLAERATACGIEVETIQMYIDAFKLGAPPHAGAGIGMERVVMLFLGLNNIRKVSMFPRDPKRLSP